MRLIEPAILNEIFLDIDPVKIYSSPIHDKPGSSLRWFKVVEIEKLRLTLGIAETGFWVKLVNEEVIELGRDECLLPLLPCLKLSPDEFFLRLRRAIENAGLSQELINTFPLEGLLTTAVCSAKENASMYWIDLALHWIEQKKYSSVDLLGKLREIGLSGERHIPQKIRHRALKLSKVTP